MEKPPGSPEERGFQSLRTWSSQVFEQGNVYEHSGKDNVHDGSKGVKILTTRVSRYDPEIDDDQPTPIPPKNSGFSRLMEKFWLFEIAALLASTLGLIAIVAILGTTNNKPIPDWQVRIKHAKPLAVTINSVISLFSTLVKSTVLIPVVASLGELKWLWFGDEHRLTDIQVFDGAAKGPLGSAIMLWTFKGRSLARLGAIITIGSLGLDFGFQQLVTYPLKPVNVGQAFIPRTSEYTLARAGNLPNAYVPDVSMIGAIWSGSFAVDNTFPVTPTCSTGNCTWDDYTSLGICSKCYNTTDLLQKSCSSSIQDGTQVPQCSYTLPSGQNITTLDASTATLVNMAHDPASIETYFGKAYSGRIATMSLIRSTWDRNPAGYWEIQEVNATECGLEVCVIKYHGSESQTIFEEHILATFTNNTSFLDLTNDPWGGALAQNDPVVITTPDSWSNDTNHTYTMDSSASAGLRYQFTNATQPELWTGVFQSTLQPDEPGTGTNDLIKWLRALNDTEIAQSMTSLAASMTRQIRTLSGTVTNTPNAIGQTWQDIPHVQVRWGWLALPSTILFLSAIFLAATMIQAQRQGATMLWKSNGLAQFYHPLTKDGRDKIRHAGSARHALRIAEGMRVRWHETEEGGRFVTTR